MSEFIMKRVWSENHTTRNAFYQEFHIREGGKARGLSIFHYGALKASEGEFSRPVKGGQVKLDPNTLASEFMVKTRKKRNEGYSSVMSPAKQQVFGGEAAFSDYIVQQFGASKGHEILQHFGLTTQPITPTDSPLHTFDDGIYRGEDCGIF